ncbi:hypothetical protein HIM_00219 [Hirsutella minnesotensis 3608]|nr:hypothetical protein HIM_00219 [Hirsutella minnesotensis 3608]
MSQQPGPSPRNRRRLRSPPPPSRSGAEALGIFSGAESSSSLAPPRERNNSTGAAGSDAEDHGHEHDVGIPTLQSIGGAIFVPIEGDLAAEDPLPLPPTTAARLTATLAHLDAHADRVRENIHGLVRRECVRILRQARADELRLSAAGGDAAPASSSNSSPPCPPLGSPSVLATAAFPPAALPPAAQAVLAHADRTAMIANMEAPAEAASAAPLDLPPPDFSKVRPPASVQERATRELTATVSRALTELKDFDAHAARSRSVHEQALQREIDREAQ